MRILLSFENFISFGGTETYNLTLAHELERLGHDAAIYSPNHGEMAEHARDEGIRVLTGAQLPPTCDLASPLAARLAAPLDRWRDGRGQ